jgi:aminopeptidase YwaD
VLLIAHRDTTHVSPGASDNGSGITVVLEVLRALSGVSLPFRLAGLFTAAEEGGGLGIGQYAASGLAEDFPHIMGVINLDMVGVGSKLLMVKGDRRFRTSDRINGLLEGSAAALGYHLGEYEMPMGLADITPLVARGIESSWLFKPDDPRFHTNQDIPDFVNPNDLKATADIVASAILRLAQQT